MSDKIFIDTNVWLYALIESDESLEKHHKAKQCIANTENIIISTQVVNEVCVNLLRKGTVYRTIYYRIYLRLSNLSANNRRFNHRLNYSH